MLSDLVNIDPESGLSVMIFVDKGLNFNLLCVNAGLPSRHFQLREGSLAALPNTHNISPYHHNIGLDDRDRMDRRAATTSSHTHQPDLQIVIIVRNGLDHCHNVNCSSFWLRMILVCHHSQLHDSLISIDIKYKYPIFYLVSSLLGDHSKIT